jgi:hypothetical protein
MKSAGTHSLRDQVQKWLALDVATAVRIDERGRLRPARTRYVLVGIQSTKGFRSMYFFLHSNGDWYVYPPPVASRKAPRRKLLPSPSVDGKAALPRCLPVE